MAARADQGALPDPAAHRRSARQLLKSVTIASQALLGQPNGDEPTQLGLKEMTAIIDHFQVMVRPDGEPFTTNHRAQTFAKFRRMLTFLRQAGLMDHVSGAFDADGARLGVSRQLRRESEAEDLLGRGTCASTSNTPATRSAP